MRKWYQIENKEKDVTEISIYQEIGDSWDEEPVTAKRFIEKLNKINTKTINLHINSPGGSVFDGLAIYNALKAHKSKIAVKIDGLAASIASVVAMAGDTIEIPENAMMMIHNPISFVGGTADDMRKQADVLEKIKLGLVSAYHDKTDLDDNEIYDLMTDETWFTAKEAVNKGFADTMLAPVDVKACVDMNKYNFKNIPQKFKNTGKPSKTKRKEIIMDLNDFKADHAELYKDVFDLGVKSCVVDVTASTQLATDTERLRIKSVEDQLIPGHEALIEGLKWDGETTGEQAAMAVLQAEKKLRVTMQDNLNTDAVDAVDAVIIDTVVVNNDDSNFMALVDLYREENNCSIGQAISHVAKNNPSAHTDWITIINKGGK